MALGDGVRRNIRMVSADERARFVRALLALQGRAPLDAPAPAAPYDGTPWGGLDRIMRTAAAHRGAGFLPWHRGLCHRFERMLRAVDPALSLHYWDWNQDPHELFTPSFAERGPDLPFEGLAYGAAWSPQDADVLGSHSYQRMSALLESKHDAAHFVYFGGTYVNAHISYHDPYAFLLHSNVDRLYAMWQADERHPWRLDPDQVYGNETRVLGEMLIDLMPADAAGRGWFGGEPAQEVRTCTHPAVVAPPCYDTLPTRVVVDPLANPGGTIDFKEVCAGKTFARAASFRIFGGGAVTLEVVRGPGAPFAVITPGGRVVADHSPTLYQEARIWFAFTGGVPGTAAPPGAVTIRCRETGEAFTFTLQAQTMSQPSIGAVPDSGDAALRSTMPPGPAYAGVTWTWTWKPVH